MNEFDLFSFYIIIIGMSWRWHLWTQTSLKKNWKVKMKYEKIFFLYMFQFVSERLFIEMVKHDSL